MSGLFMSRHDGALFIKICGMTTPEAVNAALDCEVDAIGVVFAPSVREVTMQRAIELAAPARLNLFSRDGPWPSSAARTRLSKKPPT